MTDEPSDRASVVSDDIIMSVKALTEEQKKLLSKALFPDTHTDSVTVLGKERTLRPMPVKWARKIHAMLAPFTDLVEEAQLNEGDIDLSKIPVQNELDLLRVLLSVGEVMADFYAWEDVKTAISEEEIVASELQALVVRQQNLQNTNDFLLLGLRILVGTMQQAEIQAVRLQSMFSGLF